MEFVEGIYYLFDFLDIVEGCIWCVVDVVVYGDDFVDYYIVVVIDFLC